MSIINGERRSRILKGEIVEALLLCCDKGCSLREILTTINSKTISVTKIYLFILIDHSILSYNGEKRLYFTEQEGYNLLKYIHIEKVRRKIYSNEIEITIEHG